ncbi:gamma-glutamyltranspeptidase [Pilimelia anulata]|uniref:Glutathione hydrolase proenzyme n=1 Tax=Pilimelia anulata TaxID=53371 RepID=A0A8J3BGM0_9ACTN|nr:gamma-glutamyltransferase [Pilimelia anulata]GGK02203.1 gamma-glutamyltranspeptidase [Pilimelia anulata]
MRRLVAPVPIAPGSIRTAARRATAAAGGAALLLGLATPAPAAAADPPRDPVAEGTGGAISTVDPTATAVGLRVLRDGGNAVDAAIAAAAALGVTEPFSAGIGGGGFLLYYDAKSGKLQSIDGRETAPAATTEKLLQDDAGKPLAFPEARVSGRSVGVPGTLHVWRDALKRWGTRSLADTLRPAADVADAGFAVDPTFRAQVAQNADAFAQFTPTRALYLPGGAPPAVGSTFRNPDLARTYRSIAADGTDAFYRGPIAADIAATVARPPLAADRPAWPYAIRPGALTAADLAGYRLRWPGPTYTRYRDLDVYGMALPSSGGVAVGEALNILETTRFAGLPRTQALHRYLEASALAFADRNRYLGDGVPKATAKALLTDPYAARRACLVDPARALPKPVAPGDPAAPGACPKAAPGGSPIEGGESTTHLTVADKWGNVVAYTLTIEETGGNAMVVPGRGFLLNNELTDFSFAPSQGTARDPNLPGPGKRPRSSMSPTILLADGKPVLALGTPGGSTIITTVLHILLNRLELGMTLPAALAAPRATQRNTEKVEAEAGFLALPEAVGLTALGHTFARRDEIGAATAIGFGPRGALQAVAEPTRRGGGAAAVVRRY